MFPWFQILQLDSCIKPFCLVHQKRRWVSISCSVLQTAEASAHWVIPGYVRTLVQTGRCTPSSSPPLGAAQHRPADIHNNQQLRTEEWSRDLSGPVALSQVRDLHRSDTFLNTATPHTDKCTEGNIGEFCRKVVKLFQLLLKFIVNSNFCRQKNCLGMLWKDASIED